MASVNQICEELIRNVTSSDLEYKMNQTPYSLFFSICKKFNKNSNFGAYFQNPIPSRFKIPLAPMGALAPGSAHARPSTQAPVITSGKYPLHISGSGVKKKF